MRVAVDLREVMAQFASGVSVVTTLDPDGAPRGTTVSALTSVSLKPPLVLACLGTKSRTLSALRASGVFAVNVLAADQGGLAHAFASSGPKAVWDDIELFEGPTGSPLLRGALAHVDCAVYSVSRAGDHDIVVGHVLHAEPGEDERDALVHFRRRLGPVA